MAVYATSPPHSRSARALTGPVTGSTGSQFATSRAMLALPRASGPGGMAQRASVAKVAAITAAPRATRTERGHDRDQPLWTSGVRASTATAALVTRDGNGWTRTRGSATFSEAKRAMRKKAWHAHARGCTRAVNHGSK